METACLTLIMLLFLLSAVIASIALVIQVVTTVWKEMHDD